MARKREEEANYRNVDITQKALTYISEVIQERMRDVGMTMYALCIKENLASRVTVRKVVKGESSYGIDVLAQILDSLDLELKITPKKHENNY